MAIKFERKLGYASIGDYMTIGWSQQWSAVFDPTHYNWVDFTFINAEIEWDRKCGSLEGNFELLGFRLWICISVHEPDKEILDALKEVAGEAEKNAPDQ
jgi:hypothetical protein